jgi:hypothetical protein
VRRLPVPFGRHDVTIAADWHDRAHGDPAHRWLRRMVTDSNAELLPDDE